MAERASDVDEVLGDADAAAQGQHFAAGTAHVEAEAVELEAEVATAADKPDRLIARVTAELLTEIRVRDGGVAAEPDDYSASREMYI